PFKVAMARFGTLHEGRDCSAHLGHLLFGREEALCLEIDDDEMTGSLLRQEAVVLNVPFADRRIDGSPCREPPGERIGQSCKLGWIPVDVRRPKRQDEQLAVASPEVRRG